MTEVKIPDLGNNTGAKVIEIYVKIGDKISIDDNILMLETEKASMDVPTEIAGTVKNILVKVGDKVSSGAIVIELESGSSKEAESTLKPMLEAMQPLINKYSLSNYEVYASPSIRKLAREQKIDLTAVIGTGNNGRITLGDISKNEINDIEKSVKGVSIANNDININNIYDKFGTTRVVEISKITKISGKILLNNWITIPHVTIFEDADITSLEAFRVLQNSKNKTVKLTMTAFLVKIISHALKKFPIFNSSLLNDTIIYKEFYNIGVAVDTPAGLFVPVIKNADQKNILSIAEEILLMAQKAKDGKLKPSEMSGGTFTISSLGGVGSVGFTPIINAPEVAILGVSKSSIQPVYCENTFVPSLILPLSMSFDHRVIDGVAGAMFLVYIKQLLMDIREMLL